MRNKKNKMNIFILITIFTWSMIVFHVIDLITEPAIADDEWLNDSVENVQQIPYEQFDALLHDGKITSIWYNPSIEKMLFMVESIDFYQGDYKGYAIKKPMSDWDLHGYFFETWYPSGDDFRERAVTYCKNVHYIRSEADMTAVWLQTLSLFLPTILIVVTLFWMAKKTGISETNSSELIQTSDVELSSIIGLDEIIDDINMIIKLIKDPTYGKDIGAKTPKGILLSGSPGVGKTMIAQAISHETGVPFISVSGSDFKELYVGNGARRIRSVFKTAREKAPCIIFIDELDAIGEKRSSSRSNSEDVQTINALLKEMDGFDETKGIFVLGATNYPDKLDKALIRSGRFDREIHIQPPKDWKDCKKLFQIYLKDKKVSDDVDLDTLSRQIPGFTGADIAMVCNEAAIIALSKDLMAVDHDSIEEAIDRRIFKGSRSKSEVNKEDQQIVAFHEAGHAIASILTGQPVARITIQSTTSGVGGAVMRESNGSSFITKKEFEDRVIVAYAGRASEAIKFGPANITTGAVNDIAQATGIIDSYINEFGFEVQGALIDRKYLADKYPFTDGQDQAIQHRAKVLYSEACSLIEKNFDMVTKLAEHLMEVEKMTGKQVYEFLGVEPPTV